MAEISEILEDKCYLVVVVVVAHLRGCVIYILLGFEWFTIDNE